MEGASMVLLNFMEKNNYKQQNIARPTKINAATLSNFLKGKRPLNFNSALAIQNLFFKTNTDFILNICKSYEKMEHIRPALEYLSANYHTNELKFLLDKVEDYQGFEEIHKTYSLVLNYQQKIKDENELISDIKKMYHQIKSNDMSALLHIIEANIYGITREYKTLFRITQHVEELIEEVSDSFIKKSLTVRLYEVLAQAHLVKKGGEEKCRDYANLIISSKISAKFDAYAYYLIGTSYMFHNYEKSNKFLLESANRYSEIGLHKLEDMILHRNIKNLETFWDKNLDETENLDTSEAAYRFAKRGEANESLAILDSIEETPFRVYYRALATNDNNLHIKALGMFIKEGDYLYAQMPLKELNKNEVYREIANNLY